MLRVRANLSMPRKPKRKRVKNHSLGLLKMVFVKKKKNLLVLLEVFLGESRRDCREEEDIELMI